MHLGMSNLWYDHESKRREEHEHLEWVVGIPRSIMPNLLLCMDQVLTPQGGWRERFRKIPISACYDDLNLPRWYENYPKTMPKVRHSYQAVMILEDKIPLGKRHALTPCKCTRVLLLSLYDPSISYLSSACSTSHKILSKRLPSPEVGVTENKIALLQDLRFGISVCCHYGFHDLTTSNRCTYTNKWVIARTFLLITAFMMSVSSFMITVMITVFNVMSTRFNHLQAAIRQWYHTEVTIDPIWRNPKDSSARRKAGWWHLGISPVSIAFNVRIRVSRQLVSWANRELKQSSYTFAISPSLLSYTYLCRRRSWQGFYYCCAIEQQNEFSYPSDIGMPYGAWWTCKEREEKPRTEIKLEIAWLSIIKNFLRDSFFLWGGDILSVLGLYPFHPLALLISFSLLFSLCTISLRERRSKVWLHRVLEQGLNDCPWCYGRELNGFMRYENVQNKCKESSRGERLRLWIPQSPRSQNICKGNAAAERQRPPESYLHVHLNSFDTQITACPPRHGSCLLADPIRGLNIRDHLIATESSTEMICSRTSKHISNRSVFSAVPTV